MNHLINHMVARAAITSLSLHSFLCVYGPDRKERRESRLEKRDGMTCSIGPQVGINPGSPQGELSTWLAH